MLFVRRAEERSLSLQRIFLKLDLNLNITFVLFHSAATQTKLVFHFCVSFANLNMTQLKLQLIITRFRLISANDGGGAETECIFYKINFVDKENRKYNAVALCSTEATTPL